MIEARGLTKRYGDKVAVDNISFTVEPGTVTGFLGPNGAGKSTTMRMIMGLDKPTTGTVTVAGKKYKDLNAPLCTVGALLDAKGLHGSQTARTHLTQLAVSNGIPVNRVDKVLDMTGLTSVAKKRVKGFSLGMGQRLGIAAALLGDPDILIFDEPVNGLDPTADRLIVIGRGRILSTGPVTDVIASATCDTVRVASPQATDLADLLASQRIAVETPERGVLTLTAAPAARIGELAAAHGIVLHELTTIKASLEDAYLELTGGNTEYNTSIPRGQADQPVAQQHALR